MPLDPQTEAVLAQMSEMPSITQIPLEVLRSQSMVPRGEPLPLASVVDRTIATEAGELPVRLYRPSEAAVLPLLVYFHGGGFVLGDLDSHDAICRALARAAGCAVMAVDYRLAPEHKFPAAADDVVAAVRWAAEHAAEIGIDPARIAVGGDSAGGNLSAVAAIRLRDEGGPALSGQMLVYPVTAYHTPPTRSLVENGEGYFLTREAMELFTTHYLPDESYARHPHFAVLHVEDLAGLPPAYVLTAEYDPLRDEGEAYADRLAAAGVPVARIRYDGVIHGFFGMGGIDKGALAVEAAGAWLAGIFEG